MFIDRTNLRRRMATIGAAALMATMVAGAADAQTVIKLGWPTSDTETDPYAIMARTFADELEKAAPGKYKVQFYGNHQLGDETQMLQGLQLGTLEVGVFTSTYVGNIAPAFQLNDLPFMYADYDTANTVLDGEVGQAILGTLDSKGMTGLTFGQGGFRNVINNTRPINTPDDLAGIRLRVQPSDLFLDTFRALGANPVPMTWSDVFTAVQQGTVDGLEIPLPVIYANKYPEVTKYLSLTKHTYNAIALIGSKQFIGRMSDEDRQVMMDAAKAAAARQRETMTGIEADIVDKIKEAGMEVNDVPDLAPFRERVTDIYESYRDTIGPEIFDLAMEKTKS